jgi:DNA repair protein RadC
MSANSKESVGMGHRKRLRQKFLDHGLEKFIDEEIIELLFTLGTPRRDCKITARQTLKKFGSLAAALEASIEELMEIEGVGPQNAFGLRFIHAIARKFLRDRMLKADYIDSFDAVLDYFTHALRDQKIESFHVIFLNSQNAILHEERLSVGSPHHVILSPRQVMEKALALSASTVVLAHNHPGGQARPSQQDLALTRELVFTARLLDLWVREHLIIAADGYCSFWKEGHIKRFEREFDSFHQRLLTAD